MALLQVSSNIRRARSHSLHAGSDTELVNISLPTKEVQAVKSLDDFEENKIITLNVGGQIFKTHVGTLLKVRSEKLASIARRALNNNSARFDQEYFFDRNPEVFASILDYCRFNKLHLPKNICSVYVRSELAFWGISEKEISKCCQKVFFDHIDQVKMHESLASEFAALKPKGISKSRNHKEKIYDVLHHPETSTIATIWAIVYYILVVVSVINIFLSTVPQCRVPVDGAYLPPFYSANHDHNGHLSSSGNSSSSPQASDLSASAYLIEQLESNVKVRMLVTTEVTPVIKYIDMICVFYFTVEFVARVITVPSLCRMFKDFFTFCDLLYLVPVWILHIGQWSDETFWRKPEHIVIFLLFECCIVVRVVALFRVAKHYRGLRVLVLSLKASLGELFLLFVFIILGMIVFSSLIYCVEIFIVGNFENMFYGLWWSLITMTTVGYGDVVPLSGFGYLVACVCAITGIILIGMIVPIITNNFHQYYNFRQCLDETKPVEVKVQPTIIEPIEPPPTPKLDENVKLSLPVIQTVPTIKLLTVGPSY